VGAGLVGASGLRADATPSLQPLRNKVKGTVVGRAAAGYDEARRLFSPRFDDVRPLAVVYCTSAADVAATISWACLNDVRMAARSGGHSYGGYSTTTGVVIDVSRLDAVTVDAAAGTARIGAGARLIDVYAKLAQRGVTIPAGSCPSVGIAGLALGGGIGFSGRKLGLTCDNVKQLTVVTADGVVRTCNSTKNADLFWACRGGGGGNFGVVTSFTFRTHPVSTVTTYRANWDWRDARQVVSAWQGWAPQAPDELFSMLGLTATDSGGTIVGSQGQFFGTAAQLDGVLQPFLAAAGTPTRLDVETKPYLEAVLMWANCAEVDRCRLGNGVRRSTYAAKSDIFTAPLSTAGIDKVVAAVEARAVAPAAGSLLFDAFGGAIARVPKGATAFVHRDAKFSCQYIAGWDPPESTAGAAAAISWLRNTYAAMRPHASGRAYQNYIDPELPGWGQAYYGSNYARLRRIKRRYDPKNVFRFAKSIVPAPS
jgi:FAD/FMN-containing dehydrogenase